MAKSVMSPLHISTKQMALCSVLDIIKHLTADEEAQLCQFRDRIFSFLEGGGEFNHAPFFIASSYFCY
jgi:hypothetical protein